MSVFRGLIFSGSGARLELGGGIGEQFGNFTKKSGGALLCPRRNFFFHVAAQTSQLLIQPLPDFLKLIHVRPPRRNSFRLAQTISPTPVL
jgi:hypothetical protein